MNERELIERIEKLRRKLNKIKLEKDSDREEILKLSKRLDILITIATKKLYMKVCNKENNNK